MHSHTSHLGFQNRAVKKPDPPG